MRNVFFTIALVALACSACESDAIMYTGENNARRHYKKLGMKIAGVSCSTRDSDQDGYTSCTVNTGTAQLHIDCSYRSGGSCKDKTGKMLLTKDRSIFHQR